MRTYDYNKEANDLLARYHWSEKEAEIIKTRLASVIEKFFSMNDEEFDLLREKYDGFICGEVSKKEMNRLFKKYNTSDEEMNIYLTW